MKFGFSLGGLSPRYQPALAQAAEQAGFETVWVPDHLVFPEPLPASYLYTEDGTAGIDATTATYDPFVLLGAVASMTETIRLGTNVFILPLRNPIVVARAVLTVDRISHGRFTFGAGVGWLKDEFDIVGENAANRGKRTDEIIPLLRRLWSEPVIEHHGEFYDIPPIRFEPKAYQQPIPIEIGGVSEAALRRAGQLGDGWIEIGPKDPELWSQRRARVMEYRKQAGRDHLPFIVSASFGNDLDSVERARDLGVDRVMVTPSAAMGQRVDQQFYRDVVARFADEVITRI